MSEHKEYTVEFYKGIGTSFWVETCLAENDSDAIRNCVAQSQLKPSSDIMFCIVTAEAPSRVLVSIKYDMQIL